MTERKLYGATFGPYLYDDVDLIDDADSEFPSMTYDASVSSGLHLCAGVRFLDTNQSNHLTLTWNEDDTANRALQLLVAGGNRSITLNENFTIADGYNVSIQALGQANALVMNEGFTIGNGSAGTLTYTTVCTLTVEANSLVNQDLTSDAGPTFATLKLTGVVNAATDTDKFLVVDASNNIDFRTGAELLSDIGGLGTGLAVLKTLFNANTILAATSDDTPAAITVGEQTLVGRITSGNITALSVTQIRTLINVEDGADVTDATNVNAAGATMNSDSDVKANSWTIDEDNMASDLDTKVPTQQSVKAYVDAVGGVSFAAAAALGTL